MLYQETGPSEVIAVVDHNPGLQKHIAASFPDVRTVANGGVRGLSGARNTGISEARGDIVAFLDDDAIADPQWLLRMIAHYANPLVMGVGGSVVPNWQVRRPRWFPEEFYWVVGCSYKGQPEKVTPVRNPIGCNMSFRRELFSHIGGFKEAIGRNAANAAGCEETELCIRARQAFPESIVLYDPAMIVHHQVAAERAEWRYFRRRCLAEGHSKTLVVNSVGAHDGLSSEYRYVIRVLPIGVARGIGQALLKFDPWGLARAVGIFAGLGFTAFGYLGARVSSGRR